jgi:hypothetical protein
MKTKEEIVSKAIEILKNTNLPEKGRIPVKDKILYALRDIDRFGSGHQGIRHKSSEHALKALRRYLKEAGE